MKEIVNLKRATHAMMGIATINTPTTTEIGRSLQNIPTLLQKVIFFFFSSSDEEDEDASLTSSGKSNESSFCSCCFDEDKEELSKDSSKEVELSKLSRSLSSMLLFNKIGTMENVLPFDWFDPGCTNAVFPFRKIASKHLLVLISTRLIKGWNGNVNTSKAGTIVIVTATVTIVETTHVIPNALTAFMSTMTIPINEAARVNPDIVTVFPAVVMAI